MTAESSRFKLTQEPYAVHIQTNYNQLVIRLFCSQLLYQALI